MDVLLRTRVPPEAMPILLILVIPFVIWRAVKEIRFLRRVRTCTDLIPGQVSSLNEVSRGRSGSRFSPVIRYTYIGRDGEEHTDFYTPAHNYSYDKYGVGMEVHLFRDPSDGTNVYLAGEKQEAKKDILGVVGVSLLLIVCTVLCIS